MNFFSIIYIQNPVVPSFYGNTCYNHLQHLMNFAKFPDCYINQNGSNYNRNIVYPEEDTNIDHDQSRYDEAEEFEF